MSEPHSSTVKAWSFRPMTRLAMAIERMAAETGHPAVTIIRHIGSDVRRNHLFRACRSFMFDAWRTLDPETGIWGPHPDIDAENWATYRDGLLEDIGQGQGG